MAKYTRPISENYVCSSSGVYYGTIPNYFDGEGTGKYNKTPKPYINLKILAYDDDEEVALYFKIFISWSKKSTFMKLLLDFNLLPEEGEELDLDGFLNKEVEVEVENVEIDGNVYSNVKRIRPIEEVEGGDE